VKNFNADFERVKEIVKRDFGDRYKSPAVPGKKSRGLLSPERSFGSVVKLLSQNGDYTDEYNAWLASIPRTVRDLVFVVKRFWKPKWGEGWLERFHVDSINGFPGHELKYRNQKLVSSYLRVGFNEEGNWRTFALRKDFIAADKLQLEDDISASSIVPKARIAIPFGSEEIAAAYKFITNCEYRLFQRPDDAIHRGYDKKTERDFSRNDNFFSNYEPLGRDSVRGVVEDTIRFDEYSKPLRKVFRSFAKASKPDYCIATSHPRLVNGVPTKNPRYLQTRPSLENPRDYYLGALGARLHRRLSAKDAVLRPVNAVIAGRRNNPPDYKAGIRPLAVYGPLHYQELPELFMDFIASLTGKSPSTTGAGSEGALTKGPFNALPAIVDLNNALVSTILTEQAVWTSAAGHIGPKFKVDHDISLLVPEVWSRMFEHERRPDYLIPEGCLEKVDDFEHEGKTIKAGRLGYRITERFVALFFGRVFSDPFSVFTPDMLKPELQDQDCYVDGINNIVETQQRIAQNYFEDGTIEWACPPLKALLHIMAKGSFEGKDEHAAEVRNLFTLEALLASDWYAERLNTRVEGQKKLWGNHQAYLNKFKSNPMYQSELSSLQIDEKLRIAEDRIAHVSSPAYLEEIQGSLGTEPALFRS
jgi:hypothetical protein